MSKPDAPTGIRLGPEQRLAWLRLIRSENVGPVTFRALINRFGSAQAALEALPSLAQRGGSTRSVRVASAEAAEAEMAQAERLGARFVCVGEPDYPAALRAADAPPPVLAIMGDASVLNRPTVAVVGARNASLAGIKFARHIAAELGRAGFVVVSGVARGIDAAAHDASLETGTIGVFAGGLDRPYPRENRPLMRRIVDDGGCLVSEMPFGWEPRAIDFPRRNRVVAGLSLGLLVVEAASRSGSLISARLAAEMGRLVFAVPGSPLDPRAGGTNQLLKDGSLLVTEASDMIEALRPMDGRLEHRPGLEVEEPEEVAMAATATDDEREGIIEALGPTPVAIDDLIEHTGAAPGAVHLTLLELDLAGRLERHSGGRVSLLF
ncbi:DNA processing protein DprA [Aureimonas sp. SA4125]|uniref:DNA-processing protein DprA n=1 Tax=Aureimonas sp. SA4125 TaxID=2826993 RepID=UPI001CC49E13|nr:DNA-processing protein DprA [Aureimonas sp. SA4125]BDA84480.1 DNA processing protein DprA [Aureimonas sp. SA4125]